MEMKYLNIPAILMLLAVIYETLVHVLSNTFIESGLFVVDIALDATFHTAVLTDAGILTVTTAIILIAISHLLSDGNG